MKHTYFNLFTFSIVTNRKMTATAGTNCEQMKISTLQEKNKLLPKILQILANKIINGVF